MATYVLTLSLTEDGRPLPGTPITKTLTTTESKGRQSFSRPDAAATFTELPLTDAGDINLLLVQADQAFTLRLNDQTDAGVPMKANGLFLLVDSNILTAATNKAALENASGSATTVTMIAGGS